MLRISKLTDYGVVLATHLAAAPEAQPVRDLAVATRIPQPTVSKVLKALTKAGVVLSQRGARGGYMLARPADETHVLDVIAALEGPVAVTECSDESAEGSCEYETDCGVRANWVLINEAVQRALRGITLADMNQPSSVPLVTLARSEADARRLREDPPPADAPAVARG
jgi:FeS assembly SUF system regulator